MQGFFCFFFPVILNKQVDFFISRKLTRLSFIGLRELEEIDLAGNFISYIEPETFAGLPNLNRVNLAENEMQTLERYYFRATTFERIYLSLDGNNFYCNEDLKEEINAIKHKIDVGGLVCTGGEIWRVFGKVRGRNYEDIESQIRKNFDSWEIALLTVACFIVVCIGLFIALVVLRLRSKGYQTGESVNPKEGATKRDPNVRASVRDSMMDEGPSNNESSNPSGRRIEITSEDPYNNDDDDDMIFTPASAQPQNNDPGHHTPPNEFNNDSRI